VIVQCQENNWTIYQFYNLLAYCKFHDHRPMKNHSIRFMKAAPWFFNNQTFFNRQYCMLNILIMLFRERCTMKLSMRTQQQWNCRKQKIYNYSYHLVIAILMPQHSETSFCILIDSFVGQNKVSNTWENSNCTNTDHNRLSSASIENFYFIYSTKLRNRINN